MIVPPAGRFEPPAKRPVVEAEVLDPAAFLTDAGVESPAEADCSMARVASAIRREAAAAAVEPKDLVVLSSVAPAPAIRSYGAVGLGDGLIPFAAGLLSANPGLRVVALGTGGGGAAAGWIAEAARRNFDMTLIIFNGGSCRRSGGGTPDASLIRSALAADAGFAARVFPAAENWTSEMIGRALRHKGFALVDCVGLCPVHDEPESCRRFEKASYDLGRVGHDPSHAGAARGKAEEPFDAPPLGLFFESDSRGNECEGCPVRLPVGPGSEEWTAIWNQFL